MRWMLFGLTIIIAILFYSCQPSAIKRAPGPPSALQLPDSARVSVNRENVRLTPNGRIIGKIRKGTAIAIDKRYGNWLLFHNQRYSSAYIWAPSAGFNYLNLYNPSVYWDISTGRFYSVDYFRQLFGSPGEERREISTEYQLFFAEIGLGSHKEIVMEVVTESTEKILHGITLFVDAASNRVQKVKIDFFRPVKGVKKAAKKCGFNYLPATTKNEGHVIWQVHPGYPGLTIDLERKEWQSNWFTSVWFSSLPD